MIIMLSKMMKFSALTNNLSNFYKAEQHWRVKSRLDCNGATPPSVTAIIVTPRTANSEAKSRSKSKEIWFAHIILFWRENSNDMCNFRNIRLMKFTQPSHQCDERVTYHRWGAAGAISQEENLVHTARSYVLHLGVHIFFFVPLSFGSLFS